MEPRRWRSGASRGRTGIFLVLSFQVLLGLVCLKTVPRVYFDDAIESSYGYHLAKEGVLRTSILEGFGGMHIHYVQPRIILPLICAVIFKFVGFSIFSARIGSVMASVVVVTCLYLVTKRWYGPKAALLVAVATILHPWFFEISRRVRSEIYYLAFVMAALLWICKALESNSRRQAFFAGVFAGISTLAHPSGLVMSVAIAGSVLFSQRRRGIRHLLGFALLGFAGSMVPYAVYVLSCCRHPEVSFFEQLQNGSVRSRILMAELTRWRHFYQWPKGLPLAAVTVGAWAFGWYRSNKDDRTFASIILLFALMIPFVSVNPAGRYLATLTPFFSVLLVRMVWRLMKNRNDSGEGWLKIRSVLGGSIVVTYVLMCVVGISLMFYRLHDADFDRVVERIGQVVNREDHVYGEKILWLGHDRYTYGPFPVDYTVKPWRQTVDMVCKYHYDYAVRSAWRFCTSHGISSPPSAMPEFRANHTIDEVCRRYGAKVDEFRDPYFGPFEIYKLDLNRHSDSDVSRL